MWELSGGLLMVLPVFLSNQPERRHADIFHSLKLTSATAAWCDLLKSYSLPSNFRFTWRVLVKAAREFKSFMTATAQKASQRDDRLVYVDDAG